MTFALLIVLFMGLPMVVGPPVVMLSWRRRESRLRRAITGPLLMKGILKVETHRSLPDEAPKKVPIHDPCNRPHGICCAMKPCGGPVADLIESYVTLMKEVGEPIHHDWFDVRIGIICLRCGHLEKDTDSHVIGALYRQVHTADQLVEIIKDRSENFVFGSPDA